MLLNALLKEGQNTPVGSREVGDLTALLPDNESSLKIKRYQDFKEKKLAPQLSEYQKARDVIYKELGQYLSLRNTIELTRQ